jgi:hypothetical protein
MPTEKTASFSSAPARKLEPGSGILGIYKETRQPAGCDSPIYVFQTADRATAIEYWGGKAIWDMSMRDMKGGEILLVVHYGKEKREGLKKGTEVNNIRTWILDQDDLVKCGGVLSLVALNADVAVKDVPAILAALGLEALKK